MDFHILAQGIIYIFMFISGMVMSITTGVTRTRFDGQCILYADFTDKRKLMRSSAPTCDFPIFIAVVGLVIYGLEMGVYYMYSFYKSIKDSSVGSVMWVIPFLIVNAALFVLILVAACIVTVGFSTFCDNYLRDLEKLGITECKVAEDQEWTRANGGTFNPGNYISLMDTCMVFAWLAVVCLILQIGLGILRVLLNRRGDRRESKREGSSSA